MKKQLLSGILHYSGVLNLVKCYNNLRKGRLTILAFHRVGDYEGRNNALHTLFTTPQTFEKIMDYVLKHYKIISMSEFNQRRATLQPLPRDSLIITFDDGYYDVFVDAFPILREKGLPFVLFIPSKLIHNDVDYWWDRFYYYCQALDFSKVVSALNSEQSGRIPSLKISKIARKHKDNRDMLAAALTSELTNVGEIERTSFLNKLNSLLPDDKRWSNEGNELLNLAHIREMINHGVEIGSHTETHCFLDTVTNDKARKEIFESKRTIEQTLDMTIPYFSYPAGKWTVAVRDLVESAKYSCACITEEGVNEIEYDPYLLKRINLWEQMVIDSDGQFRESLLATRLILSDFIEKIQNFRAKMSDILLRKHRNSKITNSNNHTKSLDSAKNAILDLRATRKIKILYMIDVLEGYGGTEKHLLQLVKGLDRKRFECYVVALESESFMLKDLQDLGCHVLPWSLNKIYSMQAFSAAVKLCRFLKKEQIDIVQTFLFGSDNYGSIIARLANVPLIISSRRDMGFYRTRSYRIMDSFTQRLAHRFLSVCDAISDSMVEAGIPEDKITRIYNGIELSQWPERNGVLSEQPKKKLNIVNSSFVIGNISHFRPEKGHDVFFKAVRKVASQIPNLRVLALGEVDSTHTYFVKAIQEDEILKEIVTIDHVQDIKNVMKYLAVMDVACLTAVSNEGFSNAILEEMASGKPVIATDVGGNAEAVVDGETGYIIPPNDVDALEHAILKLYHNPELRIRMGAKGRQRVETRFTLEKMIQSIENYYLETLHEIRK